MEWNRTVDRAIVSGVPEAAILLLEHLIAKVMQKAMDFSEKVIGKGDDAVKETIETIGKAILLSSISI